MIELKINLSEIVTAIVTGAVAIFLIFAITKCTMEENKTPGTGLQSCLNHCSTALQYDTQEQECFKMCMDFFDKHPELIKTNSPEVQNATMDIVAWVKEGVR
ncbi:hypothetical protein KY326_01655 [Candidatus Woesearchaeota archaeon]|nr:hypothetical protein [Candidatus Woesearchaeota archaeon]